LTLVLPAVKHAACNTFVFQQDSAPAGRARETIKLLQRETQNFISPHPWPHKLGGHRCEEMKSQQF